MYARKFIFCLGIMFAWACNEEEQDIIYRSSFSGDDNSIASFSLVSADGETYTASICNDTISLSLPSILKTDRLKAEYFISENAAIQPDPATIKDWAKEYDFTVTSYSSRERTYHYCPDLPVQSAISQNFHLDTQKKIDEFGKTGIEEVMEIVIGSNETDASGIKNLKGLKNLKRVVGLLKIEFSNVADGNYELPNLESAGSIYSESCNVNMPSLKKINGDAEFNNLDNISLPHLENVSGDLCLYGDQMKGMENINLQELQYVTNDFILIGGGEKIKEMDLPRIISMDGFELRDFIALKKINLKSIQKVNRITIKNCRILRDFSPFAGTVSHLDASGWNVKNNSYNPSYRDMVIGSNK